MNTTATHGGARRFEDLIDGAGFTLAHRVRDAAQPVAGKAPGLILLHGVGANEAGLAGLGAPQDPRLTVLLARGPLEFGPGQFGWFGVRFTPDGPVIQADQAEAARQALLRFIDEAVAAYQLDPARVWIAGFSQGGIMSASVALTQPGKVAGFGLLSGRILPEIGPLIAPPERLRQLQALVLHGRHDGKLPIGHARQSRQLLQDRGVPLDYREYDAGHELDGDMQRDFQGWLARQLPRP